MKNKIMEWLDTVITTKRKQNKKIVKLETKVENLTTELEETKLNETYAIEQMS